MLQLPRAMFDVVWRQLHGELSAAADDAGNAGARYQHPSINAVLGRSDLQHPSSPPLLRLLGKDLECSSLNAVGVQAPRNSQWQWRRLAL
jgi:hypothetical protein